MALILGAVGIVIVVLELFLRVVVPIPWAGEYHGDWGDEIDESLLHRSEIPGLAYELKPGIDLECWGDRVVTNQYGMRDREPVENLPDSVVRVLALGDEVTFGRLVPQESSFPSALDLVLNGPVFTPGCEFEVLNMGVTGYGIVDSATVLQHRGLGFDPDVIVLAYRLDDPESDDLQPMKQRINGVPIWKHFHVARLFQQRAVRSAVEDGGGGDYYEFLHGPESSGWERVLQSFETIQRIARRPGGQPIPVVLMLMPALRGFDDWDSYPYAELHSRLQAAGKGSGFEVLDLVPVFAQRGKSRREIAGPAGLLSVEGHQQVALILGRVMTGFYPCLLSR